VHVSVTLVNYAVDVELNATLGECADGNAHFYTSTCLHRPTSCRAITFYQS